MSSTTKRVGIFSGTFDPIHNGHISFAKQAAQAGKLDKVFFLVEPRPRRKQAVKSFEHRLAMVQLAIADYPEFACIELRHSRFNVADTLPLLQARFSGSQLCFLLGDDMLTHFTDSEWPLIDEFIKSVELIVGVRKRSIEEVKDVIKIIEETRGVNFHYKLFTSKMSAVSSSEVREHLRNGNFAHDLPPDVYRYIIQHRLYKSSSSAK
jgi:nicotinate-nucleotide adenylyltransferase